MAQVNKRRVGKAGKAGKPRKRRISKKQQAIYRRRRIVVGVALLLVLALISFCVYSLGRGIGAINTAIHHDEVYAVSRDSVPTPRKTSSVKDCSAKNLSLQLSSKYQSVAVGGSMEFTATIVHEGTGSCLVDGSDEGRILTITSGNETIYKSDVCPADSRMLLMAKGDKDVQQITWNADANATLTECTDESTWPRVNAGTYVAQLSLKDAPKVKSEPLVFTVQ
ncbi:hypothetical protein [Bifidobacterium myosotis]|uniref:hypothetical protein n=1 Tax=Bifidobacterium myosotis TaxID=1630166 RepID=UPI001CC3274F|nr:hypothetical protein [Bifidobacterium myosotis]